MSWVSLAILDSHDRKWYRLLNDDFMVVWIWQKMQLMMLMLQPTDGQVCIPLHINCQLVFDILFLFFSFFPGFPFLISLKILFIAHRQHIHFATMVFKQLSTSQRTTREPVQRGKPHPFVVILKFRNQIEIKLKSQIIVFWNLEAILKPNSRFKDKYKMKIRPKT